MKHWNPKHRPSVDECPKHYCFNWVPPGGSADLSGKVYDSFEEAVEGSKKGVVFLKGGCAVPFGPCRRGTGNSRDNDCYEPHNSCLKSSGLQELFFCNPENLDEEDQVQYNSMARKLWDTNS